MRRAAAIIIICSLLFLGGCYSKGLKLFAIVSGMGLDFKDDQYILTAETLASAGGEGELPVTELLSGEGATIPETIEQCILGSGKQLYFQHMWIVIFSEELINSRFENALNYLMGEHNIRLNCRLFLSGDETSAQIFSREEPKEEQGKEGQQEKEQKEPAGEGGQQESGGEEGKKQPEQGKSEGGEEKDKKGNVTIKTLDIIDPYANNIYAAEVKLNDFYYALHAEGIDGFLPVITKDRVEGIMLFSDKKMAVKLEGRRIIPLMLLTTNTVKGSIISDFEGRPISAILKKYNKDISVSVEDGQVRVKIGLDAKIRVECPVYGEEEAYLDTVEKSIKEDIEELFAILKENRSDPVGIGQRLMRYHPAQWNEVKDDWYSAFADSIVEVEVKVQRISTGRILWRESDDK